MIADEEVPNNGLAPIQVGSARVPVNEFDLVAVDRVAVLGDVDLDCLFELLAQIAFGPENVALMPTLIVSADAEHV